MRSGSNGPGELEVVFEGAHRVLEVSAVPVSLLIPRLQPVFPSTNSRATLHPS